MKDIEFLSSGWSTVLNSAERSSSRSIEGRGGVNKSSDLGLVAQRKEPYAIVHFYAIIAQEHVYVF